MYSDLQYVNPSHVGNGIMEFLTYPLIGIPNVNTYPLTDTTRYISIVRSTSADLIEASD